MEGERGQIAFSPAAIAHRDENIRPVPIMPTWGDKQLLNRNGVKQQEFRLGELEGNR